MVMGQLLSLCFTGKFFRNDLQLLHDLNTHCQIEVLRHLNVTDLLLVSKLDGRYFEALISKFIIGNKLVKVNALNSERDSEVLQVFGKSIRRLRVDGEGFDLMLQTITDKCSPNKLTDLQIIFVGFEWLNGNAVRNLPPLTNLLSLRLENRYNSRCFVSQLNEIAVGAPNLKVLKVRGRNVQGDWLRTEHMKNLRELWMHTAETITVEDLTYFVREHPKLEVFSFSGDVNVTTIGNCLARFCKNLKTFRFEHATHPFGMDTDPYRFLSSFPHLKIVSIASANYIRHPLRVIAAKYKVKELKTDIALCVYKSQYTFKYSVDSSTAEINIEETLPAHGHLSTCQHLFQQIVNIVSELKHLEKITLRSGRKLVNIHPLLERTPKLRTLSISNVGILHLPTEIRRIVRTLQKLRKEKNYQHILHLIVNKQQFNELEVYKKENIVTVSIDPQFTNKTVL